jgi:outer membrane protein TolC
MLHRPSHPQGVACASAAALLMLVLSACAQFAQHAPQAISPGDLAEAYAGRSLTDPRLREYLQDSGYPVPAWPLPAWDAVALTLAAYFFSPELRVAAAQWRLQQAAERTAAQRVNPTLNLPLEHHSDTSGGRSPWLIGIVFDLIFEREAKVKARVDAAAALSEAARIEIEHSAWQVRSRVRHAWIDYWAARRKGELLEAQAALQEEALQLLARREALGEVGSFEVSSARLEQQRVQLEIAGQSRDIARARNTLAAALSLTWEALADIRLQPPEIREPDAGQDVSVESLQATGLLKRYDIRKALFEYAAREADLRLEIEKQYPDIKLSPGFIFDQDDKIWALGAAWVLPLLHRNEGPIGEALARRELERARFQALQAGVIQELARARGDYLASIEARRRAQALVAVAQARLQQVQRQFDSGYADRLDLARARQETFAAERAALELQMELLNSKADLEDALQYPLDGSMPVADALAALGIADPDHPSLPASSP